jgi:hypothetical protein
LKCQKIFPRKKVDQKKNFFFFGYQSGQPLLNDWLRELQKIEHNPPVDFDLSIGAGSQDLLTKVIKKNASLPPKTDPPPVVF